jgi:hypothetical protein
MSGDYFTSIIKKNAVLEKKIEEAKTSSGLFIDFVREKLGMK